MPRSMEVSAPPVVGRPSHPISYAQDHTGLPAMRRCEVKSFPVGPSGGGWLEARCMHSDSKPNQITSETTHKRIPTPGLTLITASLLFWLYALLKLFVIDVDVALFEVLVPGYSEVLRYRVFFWLGTSNCSPPPCHEVSGKGCPASVMRMASRAPQARRLAVSMTERISA